MELIKPPDQRLLSGCIAKNWDLFKQKFELFLHATADPKDPSSEATKTALLLSVAGNDALEVFNNFTFVEGESKEDYATVVQKFEAYCKEQLNEVYERYMFRSRTQAEAEPFEHFLRDLRKLARSCNFADLTDSVIRDHVVFGPNNVKLREKMLKVKDLTLLKAEEICNASEASGQQNETWGQSERVVAVVKRRQQFRCSNCNRSHERGRYPAFGKACFLCGGQNHFAACCKSGPRVGEVVEQRDTFDILDVSVCTVGSNADWIVNAQVADQNTVLKVDTGSQANLLPYSVYRRCRNVTGLQPSGSILRSYSGDVIKHIGVATLPVVANNKSASFTFFILKKGRQPILGLQASEALRLVCRPVDAVTTSSSEGILQEFSHLFQGTGRVAREYRMVKREDAVPVVLPARRVPVALQDPFRQELERLERGGIIEKVDEPTDWVSQFVISRKKDGTLRVCIDPRCINECLKRERYQMPKREEIEAELAGAKYFSRLDANSGFHQIPLDEATSKICIFGTPFGRYRFLRLPFGISSAPEVFQNTLSEIFDRAPSVRVYVDDVLIWGATKAEHDARLRNALQLASQAGLTFISHKYKFALQEVDFLGGVISHNGIRPNTALSASLAEMPIPEDKAAVHRMLGVANYFGKYIPNLADKTKLLRSLVKKDTVFESSDNHKAEWKGICETLSSAPLLALFDAAKETKIGSYASKDGVGAALSQLHGNNWRPVAYASRVMTDSEQRYSQIEKETMSITFGCEKFHHFVYGRQITIETDHRPLKAIASKGIGDMPPRLQRFFLRLLKYDYVLQFVPWKELLLADMLSRSPPRNAGDNSGSTEDVEIHAIATVSDMVSKKFSRLVDATANDADLQKAMAYLRGNGDLGGSLKPFAAELSTIQGILLKGTKVVVPKSMRAEMLQRIHEGHLGMNKCKAKARLLVFWPGLNGDIETMLKECAVCRKYAYKQQNDPYILRPIPNYAWYRVGIDIFQHGGNSYLCVFDTLSNFPEVERLRDTTANSVIDGLSCIFARYGIPVEVCSDNGPQFSSHEFALFASRNDFKPVTSSPGFPQSNGLARKGVQVVKRILKKTQETHDDFWLGLLGYRSTPVEDGRSPGELLQGRRLRTQLPDYRRQPRCRVFKRKQRDPSKRNLTDLEKGQVVRVHGKAWNRKAKVVGLTAPRSYRIVTEDNQVLRRNRKHLMPTLEPFQQIPVESDESDSEESPHVQPPPMPQSTVLQPAPVEQRRSGRTTRQPRRLGYDQNFNQVDSI